MNRRPSDEARLIATVGALARKAEPPPLPRDRADIAAEIAVRAATSGARKRGLRRPASDLIGTAVVAAAAAVILGVGLSQLLPRWQAETAGGEPMHLDLPTGDRIAATAGAEFRVERMNDEARQVSVAKGTVLFDVAKRGHGSRFEVETPHLRVRVLGTVFSVQTTADDTTVRVYEGRVEIERGGRRIVLGPRQGSRASTFPQEVAPAVADGNSRDAERFGEDPLGKEGQRIAHAREAAEHRPPAEAQWDRGSVAPSATESTGPAAAGVATQRENGAASATVGGHDREQHALGFAGQRSAMAEGESGVDRVTDRAHRRDHAGADSIAAAGRRSPPEPATHGDGRADLTTARRALGNGSPEVALRAARAALAAASLRDEETLGGWRLVEADALRALGHFADAATAYERAARNLPRTAGQQAGYRAAFMRFYELGDGNGALRVLDATHADADGAALAERALGLRLQALQSLGRAADAAVARRRYLERFPNGGLASRLRAEESAR